MNISIFSCIAVNHYDAIIQIDYGSVKTEKSSHYIRNFKRKNSTVKENNSVHVGQNFQNQLPDNLAGSANPTSVQLGQKLKILVFCIFSA